LPRTLRLFLRTRGQDREEQDWKEEERDEREPAGSLHCIDSGSLIFVRPGVYAAARTARTCLYFPSKLSRCVLKGRGFSRAA